MTILTTMKAKDFNPILQNNAKADFLPESPNSQGDFRSSLKMLKKVIFLCNSIKYIHAANYHSQLHSIIISFCSYLTE